jgi:hypothetical protein
VLSFGYFSLHKQRKVTRSAGAKAFAVDVAVAFNNKQSNSTRAAEQAPLYVSQTSAPTSLDDQPSVAKKRFSLDQPLPAITSHLAVEKRFGC